MVEIAFDERVVNARFGDFDGDGRADLMTATIAGMPPAEDRQLHVFLQREDGSFDATPDRQMAIPEFSAMYDIADVKGTPGEEIVFLRPDRVTIASLAGEATQRWDITVPPPRPLPQPVTSADSIPFSSCTTTSMPNRGFSCRKSVH